MELLIVVQPPSSPAFDIKVELSKKTTIKQLLNKILLFQGNIDTNLKDEFDIFFPKKNMWLHKDSLVLEAGITKGDLILLGHRGKANAITIGSVEIAKGNSAVEKGIGRLGVIWGPSSGQNFNISEGIKNYSVDVAGYVTQSIEDQKVASFELRLQDNQLTIKTLSGSVKVNSTKIEVGKECELSKYDYIITPYAIFVVLNYVEEAKIDDFEYTTLQLSQPPPEFPIKGLPWYIYVLVGILAFIISSKYSPFIFVCLGAFLLLIIQQSIFYFKHKSAYNLAKKKYVKKIAKAKKEFELNKIHETRFRRRLLPDPAMLKIDLINGNISNKIRYPNDINFLLLRLGTSTQYCLTNVKVEGSSLDQENLQKQFDELKEVDNLPVGIKLWEQRSIGIKGEKFGNTMTSWLLLQLACYHSSDDLLFTVLISKNKIDDWDWLKWLPHVQNRDDDSKDIPQVIIYESDQQIVDILTTIKPTVNSNHNYVKVLLVDLDEKISELAQQAIFLSDYYIINSSDHLVDFCNVKVRVTPNFMAEVSSNAFDTFEIFREELSPSEVIKSVRQLMSNEIVNEEDSSIISLDEIVGDVSLKNWNELSINRSFSLTKNSQFSLNHYSHLEILGKNNRTVEQMLAVGVSSLLAQVSNDDISLVLICSFESVIEVFKDVPHCVGIAYIEKPDLVERCFNAIKNEIDDRTANGKSDHGLIIVVDDIENLIKADDRFEELLSNIIYNGHKIGVHLFVGGTQLSPSFSIFNRRILKVGVEIGSDISEIFFGREIKSLNNKEESEIRIIGDREVIDATIPHSYALAIFGRLAIMPFSLYSITPQKTSYSYVNDKKYFEEFVSEMKKLVSTNNVSFWKKPLARVIPFELVHSSIDVRERMSEDIFAVVGIADRLDDRTHRPWMHSFINEGNILMLGSNKEELTGSAERIFQSLLTFLPPGAGTLWSNVEDLNVEYNKIDSIDEIDNSLSLVNIVFLYDYILPIEDVETGKYIFGYSPYVEVAENIIKSCATRLVFQMSSNSYLAYEGASYKDQLEKEYFFGSAVVNGRYRLQILDSPKEINNVNNVDLPLELYPMFLEEANVKNPILGVIPTNKLFPITITNSDLIFGIFGNEDSGIYIYENVLSKIESTQVVIDPDWDNLEDEEVGLTLEDFIAEEKNKVIFISEILPSFIISELTSGILLYPASNYVEKIFYQYEIVWQTRPYSSKDLNILGRGIFFKKLGSKVHLAIFQSSIVS